MPIQTKSISEPRAASDGLRLFISSYLPKSGYPDMDLWFPEFGSPLELIINWGSERYNWEKFTNTYSAQLSSPQLQSLLQTIREQAKTQTVTLLGHAKQDEICHRSLLRIQLENKKEIL
jgi:uncharacterized protein YeaO (DUF488 family)